MLTPRYIIVPIEQEVYFSEIITDDLMARCREGLLIIADIHKGMFCERARWKVITKYPHDD